MSLKETIEKDLKKALKNKEKLKLSVLRMLLASVKNTEIQKQHELSDEEMLDVITREIKSRRDSVEQYREGGREELAKREGAEIEILESYLPEQISEEELKKLVEATVAQTGAQTIADMGKVMGALMPRIKGKADPSQASQMVKSLLQ